MKYKISNFLESPGKLLHTISFSTECLFFKLTQTTIITIPVGWAGSSSLFVQLSWEHWDLSYSFLKAPPKKLFSIISQNILVQTLIYISV